MLSLLRSSFRRLVFVPGVFRQLSDKSADGKLIWEGYTRNYKGHLPPRRTRLRCYRKLYQTGTYVVSGNPCPICKDKIKIDHQDTKLLMQFVSPHSGEILPASLTGLCRLQQRRMEAAIEKARDYGLIPMTVPRHKFDKYFYHKCPSR
ncbi:small ribosomal subunit protein mS40-like [Corticium candelabrum]|uniref:small ribosomal subunit protein mS40-like n=1 Tax=Corticium candelabrum TaxID=121492 RepID=UPI002E260936|nr:small ribosomal subunit protein mS40-like [Corticium candelabrum]